MLAYKTDYDTGEERRVIIEGRNMTSLSEWRHMGKGGIRKLRRGVT